MEEKKMSTKVLIIILGVVLLMMGMMGAGFFILWGKMSATVAQVRSADGTEEVQQEEAEQESIGPMYKMETLIVNLADQGGKRYLRVSMELELNAPEVVEEIEKRMPQLRDAILMILPTRQYADISTTAGKIGLRDEILEKMNSYLKTGSINTIYFTEFVVQ
jgi:flagellar protein FliL